MPLERLPNELLHQIAEYLEADSLHFWSLTSKPFYIALTDLLYDKAVAGDKTDIGWPWCLVVTILWNKLHAFKSLLGRTSIRDIDTGQVKFEVFRGLGQQDRLSNSEDLWNLLRRSSLPSTTTVLNVACYLGRHEMIELLINKGCRVATKDSRGSTPLHVAAAQDDLPLMELLVTVGANTSAKSIFKCKSPLLYASENGNVAAVQMFLDAGSDILSTDSMGFCALHWAAGSLNSVPVARLLINAGAEIDCGSSRGTPLHEATWKDDLEMVKFLIHAGADVTSHDEYGETALHKVKSLSIAKLLLCLDNNMISMEDLDRSTPLRGVLMKSCRIESAEELDSIALLLLEAGSPTQSITELTPRRKIDSVHKLAEYGCDKAMKVLLAKNPSLVSVEDFRGLTLLHYAAPARSERMVRCVRYLIGAGGDINALSDDEEAPLHCAVQAGDSQFARSAVRLLIEAGSDLSAQTKYGETLLLQALLNENPQIALDLLETRVDTSPRTLHQRGGCAIAPYRGNMTWRNARASSKSALDCAARHGYADVAERLIRCGVDISARDMMGNTALHIAVRAGMDKHSSIEGYADFLVLVLLRNQVSESTDTLSENIDDEKLTDTLSRDGHIAVVRHLVSEGIDVSLENKGGLTALDIIAGHCPPRTVGPAVRERYDQEIKRQAGSTHGQRTLRWLGVIEDRDEAKMESLEDLFLEP